jgi:hypothetical protein
MKHGKRINTALVICLTVVIITILAGCAGSPGLTRKDIDRRHYHSFYTDWLMFQDDIDSILLIDRPSRLSPMYSR